MAAEDLQTQAFQLMPLDGWVTFGRHREVLDRITRELTPDHDWQRYGVTADTEIWDLEGADGNTVLVTFQVPGSRRIGELHVVLTPADSPGFERVCLLIEDLIDRFELMIVEEDAEDE